MGELCFVITNYIFFFFFIELRLNCIYFHFSPSRKYDKHSDRQNGLFCLNVCLFVVIIIDKQSSKCFCLFFVLQLSTYVLPFLLGVVIAAVVSPFTIKRINCYKKHTPKLFPRKNMRMSM